MAEILSSCGQGQGHSNLCHIHIGQLKYLNNMYMKLRPPNTTVKFVEVFNFDKVTIEMAAVTLRNGPRSNSWYGKKVMGEIIIWDI